MSSDRWQNDPTNLYLMFWWHDKLFQPWLLSEKVIFWETHFSHLTGFVAPKYQVFQISATSLLKSNGFQNHFFFLASQDIVWNIVCTNYERLTTQRTCCANEIAPQGICKKKQIKTKTKLKAKILQKLLHAKYCPQFVHIYMGNLPQPHRSLCKLWELFSFT